MTKSFSTSSKYAFEQCKTLASNCTFVLSSKYYTKLAAMCTSGMILFREVKVFNYENLKEKFKNSDINTFVNKTKIVNCLQKKKKNRQFC